MIRILDIIFSLFGLILLSPIIILLYIIGLFDTGSPLYNQIRIGKGKKPFKLLKFRSMYINTQSIATHLIQSNVITKWGKFLRKSKLDELPQLINVLKGDMSLVGPRPSLPDQIDLIKEREARDIYNTKPGITGLAQIHKIDMSTPVLLADTDAQMLSQLNIYWYFKYIIKTLTGKGFGDRVTKEKNNL